MSNQSILPDTLKSWQYYKNKLPMYLQNSYGFDSHFKIFYDILVGSELYARLGSALFDKSVFAEYDTLSGIVPVSDTILKLLNIFDENYLSTLVSLINTNVTIDKYGTISSLLDNIGSIFNLKRQFSIEYIDNNVTVKKELSLNNEDFLMLIKAQILKNYYNGSYEELIKYYEKAGLQIVQRTTGQAFASIYLVNIPNSNRQYSENIQDMFKAGLLTVESLGIQYTKLIISLDNILVWDSQAVWDTGVWL